MRNIILTAGWGVTYVRENKRGECVTRTFDSNTHPKHLTKVVNHSDTVLNALLLVAAFP